MRAGVKDVKRGLSAINYQKRGGLPCGLRTEEPCSGDSAHQNAGQPGAKRRAVQSPDS
jgi:hypothetical protein